MSGDKQGEIYIGNGYGLTIKSSYNVVMKDHLSLFNGNKETIDLVVEIKADFESIPPEWHQTFIQMMSARYGGLIKCYDNTQIKPFETPFKTKRKWYQFWK